MFYKTESQAGHVLFSVLSSHLRSDNIFCTYRMVDFSNPSDAQLSALAQACLQVTGVVKEDEFDKFWRKAGIFDKDEESDEVWRKAGIDKDEESDELCRNVGELDICDFATQFSPVATGITDIVRDTLLCNDGLNMGVQVQLCKLNVYGMYHDVFEVCMIFSGNFRTWVIL